MPYIGNDIQFGELTSQTFTGDGSTVAFTMGYSVANTTSILVTSGNVVQEPTVAYTVSGTTLTFTSAPEDDDTIHVRFLGRVVDVANAAILQDSDQDTKVQVEESADEDTIRFDIAGAEDFTMTANDFTALSGSTISTNTIAETTSGSGVTIDGLLIKDGAVNNVAGKNLVQNGAMTIAQRGTVTGLGGANAYALDRWQLVSGGGAARVTISRDTDSPAGYGFSQKIDCTTVDSSVAAGDLISIMHKMEGQNTGVQSLLWGTSDAKTVTLSFWAKTDRSGGGNMGVMLQSAGTDYYATSVAITSTWTKFTVVIPGSENTVPVNDNSVELSVAFTMYSGSTFIQTAETWMTAAAYAVSGQTNFMDNTGNNVWFTGVQVEVGSVATDFEHEDINVTLAKCQRYFQRISCGNTEIALGWCNAVREAKLPFSLATSMRATPSLNHATASLFSHSDGNAGTGAIALSDLLLQQGANHPQIILLSRHSGGSTYVVGETMRVYGNDAAAHFELTAEL
jgi:hypothetical protein